MSLDISKFSQAEARWGLECVAKVFKETNNRGKCGALEFFMERTMLDHVDCMRYLFG